MTETERAETQTDSVYVPEERWLTLVTRSGMLCADTGERRGL